MSIYLSFESELMTGEEVRVTFRAVLNRSMNVQNHDLSIVQVYSLREEEYIAPFGTLPDEYAEKVRFMDLARQTVARHLFR